MSAMKVIVCAGFGPSLINFRGDLLRSLVSCDCDVVAAVPLENNQVGHALADIGVRLATVPLSPTGLNPISDLRYYRALVDIFKLESPDAVFCYTHKAVIFGLMAAAHVGVSRRVGLITGLGFAFIDVVGWKKRFANFVVRALYRVALRRSTHVFFQNPDDQKLFRALQLLPHELKNEIINGSGINLDRFAHEPIREGPLSFLMLSRLLRDKGVCEYAEAAAIITSRYTGISFHLAGGIDGNPSAILLKKVNEWQSAGHIVYHGEVADVRPLLKSATVYVLPSYREGTPRSVLEAMSTGRPIITTDAPGCRETVIPGENGFLVPIKNPVALSECMERFIREPGLAIRMGLASRRLAERKYDVRKVNVRILAELGVTL